MYIKYLFGLYKRLILLYNDDIGCVEYVDHMGSDLTIVNSARVSFGKHKKQIDDRDKKLINYLIRNYRCMQPGIFYK